MDAFINSILGSAGGEIVSNLFGRDSGPDPLEQIKLGNALDLSNQKNMFDYRINKGLEHGMTPYEMFMGPAAGAGGGTTASGQTLGNAANDKQLLYRQQKQELSNKAADRMTALTQTKMQTDAQVKTAEIASSATTGAAEISASATRYNAELQAQIQSDRLKLDSDRLNYIDIPQAAENLKLTREQIKKAINEVATSEKEFVLYMKKLSMGLDNMIAEYIQGSEGFDVTKPETYPQSKEKRKQLLGLLLGISSGTLRNIKGIQELIFGTVSEDEIFGSSTNINTLGNQPWSKKRVYPGKR